MSAAADPLVGLERPGGDTVGLGAMGASYLAGADSLARTARGLGGLVDRLSRQSWSGLAATACASACARDAAAVATAARGYQAGGAAVSRYAARLAVAQADYDAARHVAHHAVAQERDHALTVAGVARAAGSAAGVERAAGVAAGPAAGGAGPAGALAWTSPLRATARARAERAIRDAATAAREAAADLDQATAAHRPAEHGTAAHRTAAPGTAAPRQHAAGEHWYSTGVRFLRGVGDGIKDPAVMVGGLIGAHGDVGDNWSALGAGVAHGIRHPGDLGKAAIGWEDLSHGRYAHWAGELVPGVAAALLTGGSAAAVKAGDRLAGLGRAGRGVHDMAAAASVEGERLVPVGVGARSIPPSPDISAAALPGGFASADGFTGFSSRLHRGLESAGFTNTRAALQGSSVTTRNFHTGQAFDEGRVSDFDVALAGDDVFRAAREAGLRLRGGGVRTGPLNAADVEQLGLTQLRTDLSADAGRDVNFMIFHSIDVAIARGPSRELPNP